MKPLVPHMRESLERLTSEAEMNLGHVEQYLAGRGIDPDTATSSRLGFVLDPSSKYHGFLSIPSIGLDLDGVERVRGVKYRNMNDGNGSKYLSSEGFSSRLFNPRALTRPGVTEIHVTEGEFDCIILSMLGYAAVGVPGASQWSDERAVRWTLMLEGYEKVYVWGDNDDPGEKFAKEVRRSLPSAVSVSLGGEPKSDVNSRFLEGGADLIKELIENA